MILNYTTIQWCQVQVVSCSAMQNLFRVNLCQQIMLSAISSDYNKHAAESTDNIQECAKHLIDLLRKRSLAPMQCGQFDTALRDSDANQNLILHKNLAIA